MSFQEFLAQIFGAALALWLAWELRKAFINKIEKDRKRGWKHGMSDFDIVPKMFGFLIVLALFTPLVELLPKPYDLVFYGISMTIFIVKEIVLKQYQAMDRLSPKP